MRRERAPENAQNRPESSSPAKHRAEKPAAPPKQARYPCLIAVRLDMGFPQSGLKVSPQPPRFRKSLTLSHKSETHKANQLPS